MIWNDIQLIRTEAPLIHNITNYVVMNNSANALLAIGASPVMAHAVEEVEEMVGLSKALVINIGTLSPIWIEAMLKAGKEANRLNIPVIIDPVGSGATQFRTRTAHMLINEIHPAIIRGNASEIKSLFRSESTTKGVDSRFNPDEVLDEARALSKSAGCVVSVSGPIDLIVEGDAAARIENGHQMMSRVTGMGCTASSITGAFSAVNDSAFKAAINAMVLMGVAGEMAAENSAGPGSLQMNFLNVLYSIQESEITKRIKMQML